VVGDSGTAARAGSHVKGAQRLDKLHHIAIVGGGISGLSAAHYLARHRPELRIIVIERDRRLGGKIVTERIGDFVVEGGPDSFLSSKPRGLGLARELGLEARLQGTDESKRRTWVLSHGGLHRLPEGLSGLVPSRLEPLLDSDLFSPAGKERLLQEPHIPAKEGNEDESLASFISRRFGPEVYDRMIEPLMAGIYAGDGQQLSLAATFPQLRRLEQQYGSLVTGMRAAVSSPSPRSARPAFLTPIGGTGELVEALQRSMPDVKIVTGNGAQRIGEADTGYVLHLQDGSRVRVDSVIMATPAHVAAELTADLDGAMSDALGSIPHVSSATVSLAYPASYIPSVLEGYGYVVPRAEGRAVLASTWSSTKFRHRAPDDSVLIRVFIGRAGAEQALAGTDEQLVDVARAEVAEVLNCREAPRFHRVFRWTRGMPQFTMGHLDRIARLHERAEHHPGLFIAGNFLQGVGLPDCIASGELAAEAASTHIGESAIEPSSRFDNRR
jgi:oxygen-dependent protoporphyrinogen oxidase